MADERDRWLDEAAADRLLRGEPATPGAEHHARARAERLRAALDALAEPPPAPAGGLPGELRGEAAAVAAFRAARGTVLQPDAPDVELFGSADTVVELSPPAGTAGSPSRTAHASAPRSGFAVGSRRGRPVRFALAAAVASVAVGGLAAAAGAGLLDRDTHQSAGHAPAVSVTAGSSSEAFREGAYATPATPNRTGVPRDGDGQGTSPVPGNSPGADGLATAGTGGESGAGTATQPSVSGSPGAKDRDRFLQGDAAGGTGGEKERESRNRPLGLCSDYRAGRLDDDRREKLVRLAKGLLRVPRYCQGVLDVTTGGGARDGVQSSPAQPVPPPDSQAGSPEREPGQSSRVAVPALPDSGIGR